MHLFAKGIQFFLKNCYDEQKKLGGETNGCKKEKDKSKRWERSFQLWIQHEDPTPILEAAVQQIRAFEKRFSANDPASDLMKVNQNAGI